MDVLCSLLCVCVGVCVYVCGVYAIQVVNLMGISYWVCSVCFCIHVICVWFCNVICVCGCAYFAYLCVCVCVCAQVLNVYHVNSVSGFKGQQ